MDEEEEKRKQAEKEEEDRRIKKEVQDQIDEKRIQEEEEERDQKEKKRLENEMYEKNKVLWKETEKNYDYQNNWIKDIIKSITTISKELESWKRIENILSKLNIINFKTLYNYY